MMFLNCPAYLDQDGALRCGLPAEVTCRFTMRSTDGPLECARIRCPAGHHFSGDIDSLTWGGTGNRDPGPAGAGSRAGRDSLWRGHDARHGGGGSALRDFPRRAGPESPARRPNGAPAYYLARPAALWITAMRPSRRPTLPSQARGSDAVYQVPGCLLFSGERIWCRAANGGCPVCAP